MLLASALIAALSAASTPASTPAEPSQPFVRGLDRPAGALSRKVGMSDRMVPLAPIYRRCSVYEAHAVVWTEDPSVMGATDMEVRARPPGAPVERVCAPTVAGSRPVSPADAEVLPIGAIGRHLVTLYPDGHGVLSTFHLMDLETGARVFDGVFNVEKGIDLARAGGSIAVSWWTQLSDLPCLPRRGERACWKRILADAQVPPSVAIPQPDCEAIVARRPGAVKDPDGSVQITVRARVKLGTPGIEYLPEPATCDESP